jgi:uncharacterized membrane protein
MGNFYGMMGGGSWGFFGLLTWLALIVFLVLGSMFFWKEINRKR